MIEIIFIGKMDSSDARKEIFSVTIINFYPQLISIWPCAMLCHVMALQESSVYYTHYRLKHYKIDTFFQGKSKKTNPRRQIQVEKFRNQSRCRNVENTAQPINSFANSASHYEMCSGSTTDVIWVNQKCAA